MRKGLALAEQLLEQHAESMGLSALIARGLASHAARIALRKGQPEAAAAFEPTRHVPNLWRMPMEESALAQLLRATRGSTPGRCRDGAAWPCGPAAPRC